MSEPLLNKRQAQVERLRRLNNTVTRFRHGAVEDTVGNALLVAHVCQELGLPVGDLYRVIVGTHGMFPEFQELSVYLNNLDLAVFNSDFRSKLVDQSSRGLVEAMYTK